MANRLTYLAALAFSACVAVAAWGLAAAPAHAQPAAPAQVAPDYSGTSGVIPWSAIMEKPLAGAGNAAGAPGSSDSGPDASKGGGNASHEELSRSNLKESIREFNEGDGGVKKPEATEQNPAVNPLRKPTTSAAAKAAQKSNNDQWAAISMRDEMISDALPWAFGLAGLLAVGFAVKVWLSYMQAKAARPGMRRRAARKRSSRSSGSSSSASRSARTPGAPDSQGFVSTFSGTVEPAGPTGSHAASQGGSSGASGSSSSASGQRRHRSHRSRT